MQRALGAYGVGAVKWRLMVKSDRPIQVMSLLAGPTGHLTNLSSAPGGTGGMPVFEASGAGRFVWRRSFAACLHYNANMERRIALMRGSMSVRFSRGRNSSALAAIRIARATGCVVALSLLLAQIHQNAALAEVLDSRTIPGRSEPQSVPGEALSTPADNEFEPPFRGTVFIDPDILTPSDPSALIDVTYTGRGERTVFDRRPNAWIVIDAYLFDARFDDGLSSEIQVNPEFGSISAATEEATRFGRMIGQLPTALRAEVETVWIHKGAQLFGGGNNNILIHVEQYSDENGYPDYVEEALLHEGAHTSLDAMHGSAPGWIAAQMSDGGYISSYARDNSETEDLAESLVPWLAVRYRSERISQTDEEAILGAIPNRLAFFDREISHEQMYPIVGRMTATLPLVLADSDNGPQSFVRVRNRSDADGVVAVFAIDDSGERRGPAILEIESGHTASFNSRDLEAGNAGKGITNGVGDGTGNWRLVLATTLDIEARGYVRTADGFVTSMYHLASEHETLERRYVVPFFNPASNTAIRSLLHVANPNSVVVQVTLEAWDDHGQPAKASIRFSLDPGAALRVSSQQLEAGDSKVFSGRLGDGTGKWRFELSGEGEPLEVMSLLSTASGHLTNLSR